MKLIKNKLFLLFSLLLILSLYAYFVEHKGKVEEEKLAEESKKVAKIDKKEVVYIASKDNKKEFDYIFNKKSGLWWIFKPINKKADPVKINNLISFFNMKSESIIFENKKIKLADYGLQEPYLELKVKTKINDYTFKIGDKTPVGNNRYIYNVNSNKLLAIGNSALNRFKKKISDFRLKRILDLPKDKFSKIKLINSKENILLVKNNLTWSINKPIKANVDNTKINKLISNIYNFEVSDFVSTNFNPKSKRLIKKLTYIINLKYNDKTNEEILKVYKSKKDDKYYVKLKGNNEYYIINKSKFDLLDFSLFDLRKKDLFNINKAMISKIIISKDKKKIELSGEKLKSSKVVDLIDSIINTNVTGFVDKKLGKPKKEISFKDKDKDLLTISFGKENNENVYVRKNTESELYLINKEIFEKIKTNEKDY